MPQEGYGRNVKAQSDYGATSRAYQYGPKAAEDYLSGDAAKAYSAAQQTAFAPYTAGAGFRAARPEIQKREQAWDQVDRLREVAGANALGAFRSASSGLAKPYKMQAEQGLLTTPTDPRSSDTEPEMTAHPGQMAKSDKDYWGDTKSWKDRRNSLQNRTYKADESYNLLKDNDSRLALKAQMEARKLGMGPSMAPQVFQSAKGPTGGLGSQGAPWLAYQQQLAGGNMPDPEKEYAGYF